MRVGTKQEDGAMIAGEQIEKVYELRLILGVL